MGTFDGLRKAYGTLKDSTKVGLAKVNSEFKELDIAIVKATDHVECPPKERQITKIFGAAFSAHPQADVAYCVHALNRRLNKTRNWTVALKTLIVIHRTLREGDSTFRDELLSFSNRGHVLQISKFKDNSSAFGWDCSTWVRLYALFLEERLECFRILKYDIEAEHLMKSSEGGAKVHSRTRNLDCQDLLEQLPALEQLLFRLVGCQPKGAAFGNYLIQYALALVLKESFRIYCAVNDGIINLVDMYFEMSRHDAIKALDIYKRAGQLAGNLSDLYEYCKGLELARNFQFPILKEPPPSFLQTMEEYIREAPWIGSVSNKKLQYQERNLLTYKGEEESPLKTTEPDIEEAKSSPVEVENLRQATVVAADQTMIAGDLLGLDEVNPVTSGLDESNVLALAITSPGDGSKSSAISGFVGGGIDSSGWESALITSSSNHHHLPESKLAGGFDKLLLDSLYDSVKHGSSMAWSDHHHIHHQQHMTMMPYPCQPHYRDPHSPPITLFSDPFPSSAP